MLDWEREAIDLKRQGLESKDIAVAVGKSAATVRKAVAKARERGDLPQLDETGFELPAEPIEGQTTVDDFTVTCDKCGADEPLTFAPEYGANFCETCFADPQAGSPASKESPREDEPVNPREDQEDAGGTISPNLLPERDPLEDFRAEAGEAVGPMPPETPPEPLATEVVLPLMPGTRQLALDLGPNAAPVLKATVKFTSEKWPSGHFGMGDVVKGTFTARIVNVPAKEKFDEASGEFRAKDKDYGALITEIEYEAVESGD